MSAGAGISALETARAGAIAAADALSQGAYLPVQQHQGFLSEQLQCILGCKARYLVEH